MRATMAGYSGTPLVKKLGIGEGHRVAILRAPDGFAATLGELPDAVRVSGAGKGEVDVAILFVRSRAELEKGFRAAAARLHPSGGLWIAWPKRASGIATDMNENVAREVILPTGLVDNKVCAVDDVWSGLRFVVRLENRPAKRAR
jgi:hypothetical protein